MGGSEKNPKAKSYMIGGPAVGDPRVTEKPSLHRGWVDPVLHSGDDQDANITTSSTFTSERAAVLDEAARTVVFHRANEYGDVKVNFEKIAALWSAAFGWQVAAYQVALAMDLVKTARLTANPRHRDSWVDKAGYAGLGAEVVADSDE